MGEPIKASKFDQGKVRWDLMPWDAVEEIVKVLTFGAEKYGDHNWRGGLPYSRFIGAIFRHVTAWTCGQEKDPETGITHLAHAACGLIFLIWFQKNRKQFDDRFSDRLSEDEINQMLQQDLNKDKNKIKTSSAIDDLIQKIKKENAKKNEFKKTEAERKGIYDPFADSFVRKIYDKNIHRQLHTDDVA